ncbi:hypothetical protein MNBD_GAMMA01-205 [hydrothermal vent metagenome]|uniref:Uncharacterized protein n=1 Tax=hydrothermal vent metagenome TaxID=652676 RepID=A0A3B0USC1_9ZZZZ
MKNSTLLLTLILMCLVCSLSFAQTENIQELKSSLKIHEEAKDYSAIIITALKLYELAKKKKQLNKSML